MRANLYLMSGLLAAATTASAGYDPGKIGWSRLEFHASKFFMTARAEVELGVRPSEDALSELLVPSEGQGLAPGGAESGLLDIKTRILSRKTRVHFWFDPDDARALQRSSHDISKRRLRHRTYRYTRSGVVAHTLRPGAGEAARPPTGWTDVDDRSFNFSPAGDSAVTEAAGLLYLVPAGNFHAPGDKHRLRVFTRGRVREVDVSVTGTERIDVDYAEVSGTREREVDGKVEALRIAVRPRFAKGEKRSDFKLLGLQGDMDIYVEPRTRVPLMVCGKVEIAGSVRLRLRRAVLKR